MIGETVEGSGYRDARIYVTHHQISTRPTPVQAHSSRAAGPGEEETGIQVTGSLHHNKRSRLHIVSRLQPVIIDCARDVAGLIGFILS